MRKIKLTALLAFVLSLLLMFTACFDSNKKDDDDEDEKDSSSKSSKVDDDDDDDDEDDDDDVTVDIGSGLKWPNRIPKELKVDATIEAVINENNDLGCTITFAGLSEKKANDYIDMLKDSGYESEMDFVDKDGMMFMGTNDEGAQVTFSYEIETETGMIAYNDGEDEPVVTSAEEIDMTDLTEWPTNFIKGVSELEGKITDVTNSNNIYSTVYMEYVEKDYFEAYIETLKDNGFTEDADTYSSKDVIEYSAYNSDGDWVKVSLSIYETGNTAYIDMQKADEE